MTEQSIFEHVLGDDFYNQDNRDGINPLLIPDAASKICNRLGTDVTETARNSSSSVHYLRDDLLLISKLCKTDDKHNQVNATNRSVVLSCLKNSYKKEREDEMESIVNECVQDVQLKKKAMYDTIRKRIITKRDKMEQARALMLDTLRKELIKLELSSGLKFNLNNLPKRMTNWKETYLKYALESTEEIEDKNHKKLERTDNYRLKHIKFGYALINVGHKEEISTHLSHLLKSLSSYGVMHNYEKRFCEYLFKFIGEYPDLLEFYKNELFFILEIQIIEACGNSIIKTEQEFGKFLMEHQESKELNSLKAACERDTLLYSKIKNIFYSLYYFSNFNKRILHLLRNVDNSVPI